MFSTMGTPKREHQAEASVSKRQKQEETVSICSIVDMPDDILKKIILYLNLIERLPLGDSCQRFKSLVFADAELLRDLDFSKEVPISATDIQPYFDNQETYEHILRLNVRNVESLKPGRQLNNSLGKAMNVVDINIHGIKFKDIWQLGNFLNPLIHIQKLSIDWIEMKEINIPLCLQVLEKPFGRLVYLSVEIMIHLLKVFIPSLRLCYELLELRMVVVNKSNCGTYDDIWGGETKELRKLQIVEYCGPFVIKIKELFVTMLSDPELWTDFQLNGIGDPKGFHLEKNVEVCEEMLASKWTERVPNPAWDYFNLGWALFPECLLREVLKFNHQNLPEEFCCLSTFMDAKRCLLKIEDAKLLLKNPKHQISYLYLNHELEIGCDMHLVASVFSNLTELVLCGITRNLEPPLRDMHFQSRRKRRASAILEEQCASLNLDSSFRMLVENTPHLRHFTLNGAGYNNWDLEELYLIASWTSLETLRLLSIPIEDGDFLIKIAKQCKNLQKLELIRLGSDGAGCSKKELLQMLTYHRNLRDFSIEAKEIGQPSELVTALANNRQLRKVHVKDLGKTALYQWISSIEQLMYKCANLATFRCQLSTNNRYRESEVTLPLQRWKTECGRPNFQVQLLYYQPNGLLGKCGHIYEDIPQPSPFPVG